MNLTNLKQKLGPIVEHAGTGFSVPESLARQIDEASKGLPADFKFHRLAKTASIEFPKDGERADVSTISTNAVDRDGEIVLPSGLDWNQYNKAVFFAHKYEMPVGSNQWMKTSRDGNSLIAKTFYPEKPKDWGDAPWMPSAVLHMMQQTPPICTGKSIGFIPVNIRQATAAEKALHKEWDGRPIIDKAIGLEYSVAPIPCNQDAEMIAVAKGIKDGIFSPEATEIFKSVYGDMTIAPPEGTSEICPQCLTSEHVTKSGTTCECGMCGKTFAPGEQEAAIIIETKGVKVNDAAYNRAAELVNADMIDDGPWSYSKSLHSEANAADFLAIDDRHETLSADRYRYPIIRDGKVYRRGLAAVLNRSASQGDKGISEAAELLMARVTGHDAIAKALASPKVTALSLKSAMADQLEALKPDLNTMIRDVVAEVLCKATGKP